jgi:hypothetical protein
MTTVQSNRTVPAAPLHARNDDYEQALQVLRATDDGDELAPRDLWLLERVVNHGRGRLGARDLARWNEVVDLTSRNAYGQSWLHGVEHLTKTQQGNVCWKGCSVEHYSFGDRLEEERAAAHRLGACCRFLEANGREVSGREVLQAYTEARLALGLPHTRWLVTWYTGAAGAKIGIECIDATRVAESRALIEAALGRRRREWGQRDVRAVTVVTREDFQLAADELTQSCDWARHRVSFTQYSPGRHLADLLDTLHSGIRREDLPTEAQVFEAYFGHANASGDVAEDESASHRPAC